MSRSSLRANCRNCRRLDDKEILGRMTWYGTFWYDSMRLLSWKHDPSAGEPFFRDGTELYYGLFRIFPVALTACCSRPVSSPQKLCALRQWNNIVITALKGVFSVGLQKLFFCAAEKSISIHKNESSSSKSILYALKKARKYCLKCISVKSPSTALKN